MNIEEKQEKLQFLQAFFVRSFGVSFVILLLSSLMCILYHDAQVTIVNKFFPIDGKDLNYLILLVFGIWKVIIIQFTLIPALVVWCMRKCCCECKK